MKFAALLTIAALSACKPTHTQTPHTSGAADLESKTVALVVTRGAQARAYCSGVWVDDLAFVTANHCVDDIEPGERVAYVVRDDLYAANADEVAALRVGRFAARDVAHDLALIRVTLAPMHASAHVAEEEPTIGQPTQTCGHPLGLWWSYSTGTVSALRVDDEGQGPAWWVQSTAPISPGNSGGGLFDADGQLLGIAHAYFPRGENLNVYVHGMYVRAFLKAAL